jgi:RND family efflux transporter MFP subunit
MIRNMHSTLRSAFGWTRRAVLGVLALLVAGGLGGWWFSLQDRSAQAAAKGGGAAVPVTVATVELRDVPVKLRANGNVVAIQSVDLRSQVTSTVREVHIREGQFVRKGDLLVSLDARTEEANLRKAEAQVEKDRADLENAQRTLERQRQLFQQKFIAQSALDTAENQVATLRGQLGVDEAAVEAARVAIAFTQIRASFAGRTGAINVRAGSVVQPNGTVLLTVTQIDPIQVAFTLPEKEFAGLQRAIAGASVPVEVVLDEGKARFTGRVNFLDNAVDTATGTIRVKAEFTNADNRLWPGMFVNVTVSPRTLTAAAVVPVQAVQTGPDSRFVYVVGEDRKVASRAVTVPYLDEGFAVITGVEPGAKVVLEGAQNLRTGSLVAIAEGAPARGEAKPGRKGVEAKGEGASEAGRGKAAAAQKAAS